MVIVISKFITVTLPELVELTGTKSNADALEAAVRFTLLHDKERIIKDTPWGGAIAGMQGVK